MVIFKYIEDYFEEDPQGEEFCKEHNIVYFKPTPERKAWLENWLKTVKLPVIESDPDVICYWRYFGVWGEYHPEDNSISICPFEIERAGGLEEVIKHELEHLKHPEANNLPHKDKEDYINNLNNN
jgi:hypothetical protein